MIRFMEVRELLTPEHPDAPAWRELAERLDARGRLDQRLDELDREQREASQAAQAAAEELVSLERRQLSGEAVSAGERKRLETALSKARAEVAAPWGERRDAVRRTRADFDRETQKLVWERYGELAEALAEQGAAITREVNESIASMVAAVRRWEACSAQQSALASSVGRLRPGDWSASRTSALVREAERLLGVGGEVPPVVRDPRQPRHEAVVGATAEEGEADFVARPVRVTR
jgi:hypothetical protein